MSETPGPPKLVRARALITGLVLSVVAVYCVVDLPQSSITSLLAVPVGLLLLQILFGAACFRVFGRSPFHAGDHLVVFGLTSVAAAIGSEYVFYVHTGIHAFPFLAPGSPTVRDVIMPAFPDALAIKEIAQVQLMTVGDVGPDVVWSMAPTFAPRIFAWSFLLASVVLGSFFVNCLMRQAWLEREKLAFPLIQLPIEMSQSGPQSMWRSKAMWIAFAVMFSIDSLNGLNYLYPWLPKIGVKTMIDTQPFLQDAPWSAMGEFPIALYPFMAAIGLFVPNDILFSLIVFFLLRKLSHVGLGMAGLPQGTFAGTSMSPGAPFIEEQVWGAILAMFTSALWFSRATLKEVWRAIRTGAPAFDAGPKHRTAFIGLIACLCGFVAFGLIGKLPIPYLVAYFVLFLVFSVVVTRIRAQLGPPTHEFAFFGPASFLNRFIGNQWMTDSQVAFASQSFIFMNRVHRTHPAPHQLEAMKLGQLSGLSGKRLIGAIGVVSVVAIVVAFWFYLGKAYRVGNPLPTFEGVGATQTALANRSGPDTVGIGMTMVGFGIVMGMDALRIRIPGFPLHPAGYVLGLTYGVDYYWFGLALALAVKSFVQRYYGLKGYDSLRRVGLGILLAEYATELIWMTFTLITKQSSYTIGINERSLGGQ